MIKITGMALIVLCSSMMGIFKASSLSRKVSILENIIRLYQYMHDRLKYLQPSVITLISGAAASQEFENLAFLKICNEKMTDSADFAECWRSAVQADSASIGKDVAPVVASLADVLGASDLESQLAAIEYGKNLLGSRLADAREYASKHKKLYQTLGVLAGVGMAVFIA